MLDLAHDLKAKKRPESAIRSSKERTSFCCSRRRPPEPDVLLKLPLWMKALALHSSIPAALRWAKRKLWKIRQKVLGRFYDGIEYRGFDQEVVEGLAKYAGVPVWNGLTDVDHPTQILADLITIEEHVAKPLNRVKVVLSGDIRNNMSYAWMYGCAKMGMHYVAYGPDELKRLN